MASRIEQLAHELTTACKVANYDGSLVIITEKATLLVSTMDALIKVVEEEKEREPLNQVYRSIARGK